MKPTRNNWLPAYRRYLTLLLLWFGCITVIGCDSNPHPRDPSGYGYGYGYLPPPPQPGPPTTPDPPGPPGIASVVHEVAASYAPNETGVVSELGIDVYISLARIGDRYNAFYVSAMYLEPGYNLSTRSQPLARTLIAGTCDSGERTRNEQAFAFSNGAGTRFLLQFTQRCKRTQHGLFVPYLQTTIACTQAAFERARTAAIQDGKVFDITATGYVQPGRPSPYGGAIQFASDAYNVVSTVLTVLDVVAVLTGELAVVAFVIGMIEGEIQDRVVQGAFDYVREETEEKARFVHTGWHVRCRICGREFHRSQLGDGEILECPNSGCRAQARLHSN
jgi:hypothetical protein